MPAIFRTDSGIFGDIQASNMLVTGEIKVGETQTNINQYISSEVNTLIGGGIDYSAEINTISGKIDSVSGYATGIGDIVDSATGNIDIISGSLETLLQQEQADDSAFIALSGYATGIGDIIDTATGDINTISNDLYSFYEPTNDSINITSGSFDALNFQPTAIPTTKTSAGSKGQITYDENYVYLCVADNTWKRLPSADF